MLVIAIVVSIAANAVGGPEVPTLTAATLKSGHTRVADKSSGTVIKEYGLVIGVTLRSGKQPRQPYDVQCFFFGRKNSGGALYLVEVAREQATGLSSSHEFSSSKLEGAADLVNADAGAFTVNGSKFVGWVVRVISEGKVVRVESNQSGLKDLVIKNEAQFNTAANEVEPRKAP